MIDLDNDGRINLLVSLVDRIFGPQGLFALAPGQLVLLQHFRVEALTAHEAAEGVGAHASIVARAIVSLERKGLLALVESGSFEKRYRLTSVAEILLDPGAARRLAPMLALRRDDDSESLKEMVSALLGELPPDIML